MKEQIISKILEHKIIAIVRNVMQKDIIPTGEALYEGGINLIEVTFNQKGSLQDTADAIKSLCNHFGDKMQVGAGTVINVEQVDMAFHAGAKYIISPNINIDVIKRTNELGMVSIPGALTPTEVVSAWDSGADFVKLFPVGELGINYIKAVMSPINHIPMLAVGGVDENNLKDFLNIGIKGAGIGSNIVKSSLIKEGRFEELTSLARKYTNQI